MSRPLCDIFAFLGQGLQCDANCREATRSAWAWRHAFDLPEPDRQHLGVLTEAFAPERGVPALILKKYVSD